MHEAPHGQARSRPSLRLRLDPGPPDPLRQVFLTMPQPPSLGRITQAIRRFHPPLAGLLRRLDWGVAWEKSRGPVIPPDDNNSFRLKAQNECAGAGRGHRHLGQAPENALCHRRGGLWLGDDPARGAAFLAILYNVPAGRLRSGVSESFAFRPAPGRRRAPASGSMARLRVDGLLRDALPAYLTRLPEMNLPPNHPLVTIRLFI
jgi:hypothetical protein